MDPSRKPSIQLTATGDRLTQLVDILDRFTLTDTQMTRAMDVFMKELEQGLSRDESTRKLSSLQMENTYVRALLNGTEDGDFLALDLGGSNFRVLLCKMVAGKCDSVSRKYNVPPEKLRGPASNVFDHIADSVHKFLEEENLLNENLPLGFTFSFPMAQKGLKKGILLTWTKSFANTDGVGEDAVKMLEEAMARRQVPNVNVVAILNDTTGTLLAGSYLDKNCKIGVIMGTGSNSAYVEQLERIPKWTQQDDGDTPRGASSQVVIDIESGAFGDNGSLDFLKTPPDAIIDKHSNHVGSFTFEKMFAGHYLGDLCRLVLLDLTEKGLLFDGLGSDRLKQWKTLTAEHLSNIERDTDNSLDNTHRMLSDMNLTEVTSADDISVIRYVCSALSIRAAQLVCAKLGVLVKRIGGDSLTIAMDGSLYRCHPKIHDHMMSWLHHLNPNTQCKLVDAMDGSGRGAAFVAAVAVRLANECRAESK